MVKESYNPFMRIFRGEFSLREDFQRTFQKETLENLALQGFAALAGVGVYSHEPIILL